MHLWVRIVVCGQAADMSMYLNKGSCMGTATTAGPGLHPALPPDRHAGLPHHNSAGLILNSVEMHLVGRKLLCNICLGCGQHDHVSACGGPASCSVHYELLWVCLQYMPAGCNPDVRNVDCAGGGATPAAPGPAPVSAAPPTSTPGPQAAEPGATQPPGREYFYKTRLCDKFMSGAGCPYGARCHYAHGEHELRNKGETKVGPQQSEEANTLPAVRWQKERKRWGQVKADGPCSCGRSPPCQARPAKGHAMHLNRA